MDRWTHTQIQHEERMDKQAWSPREKKVTRIQNLTRKS